MGCIGSTPSDAADTTGTHPFTKMGSEEKSSTSKKRNPKKKTLEELRQATGSPSSFQSATEGGGAQKRKIGYNINEDDLDAFARDYCDLIHPRDEFNKEIGGEDIVSDCTGVLDNWPRGSGAGELLEKPMRDENAVDVGERGVKISWLLAAWAHLKKKSKKMLVPTRAFGLLFVRPFLGMESKGDGKNSLYDFIPMEFRAKPYAYVCHGWDGWLRQILFISELVTKDWPSDSALWMDVFALPQADLGPTSELVNQTKRIVQDIGRTLVVFPGDGYDKFALLPIYRKWCLFEIALTPPKGIMNKIGLHGDLGDVEFHKKCAECILNLKWSDASTTLSQDRPILEEALIATEEMSISVAEERARNVAHDAFSSRYANVASPGALKPTLGRYSSLSDVYDLDRDSLKRTDRESTANEKQDSDPNF